MASIVNSATFQSNSTTGTTRAVTLPVSRVVGNMMVMVFRAGGTITATPPAGWSEIGSRSNNGTTYIWGRIVDGTEDSTATVTISSAARAAAITYQIQNTNGLGDVVCTFAGTNVNNPPSGTATWGTDNNLFIAVMTNRRSDSTVTGVPANYTGLLTITQTSSTLTSRSRVSTAHRSLSEESDDPAEFTTSGTIDSPHSATIVIRPYQEPPPEPISYFEDTFERADSSSLGSDWVARSFSNYESFAIVSNNAVSTGERNMNVLIHELSTQNHMAKITLGTGGVYENIGVFVGGNGNPGEEWTGYLVRVNSANELAVFRYDPADDWSPVGSGVSLPGPLGAGDVIEGRKIGNNIYGLINGQQLLSVTDVSYNGTWVAFRHFGGAGQLVDSFEAGISPPIIITHPVSATITEGDSVEFFVTAVGDDLAYQWQVSLDGVDWVDIVSAISPDMVGWLTNTITFTASDEDDGNYYRCVVSNTGGQAVSSSAIFSITEASPPVILDAVTYDYQSSGATPTSNITVPSDAEAVMVFHSVFGNVPQGMTGITSSFTSSFTVLGPYRAFGDDMEAVGFAYAYVTDVGEQTISPVFAQGAGYIEGPLFTVVFLKNVHPVEMVRDTAFGDDSINGGTITIDSAVADLVLAYDRRSGTAPTTESGWTSIITQSVNSLGSNLRSANAPGSATTNATAQQQSYSAILGVSVIPADVIPPEDTIAAIKGRIIVKGRAIITSALGVDQE